MSDWKSKLPSLKEVASMTVKLASDIKTSVTQIVHEYKENHPTVPDAEPKPAETTKPAEPEKTEPEKTEKKEAAPTSPVVEPEKKEADKK